MVGKLYLWIQPPAPICSRFFFYNHQHDTWSIIQVTQGSNLWFFPHIAVFFCIEGEEFVLVACDRTCETKTRHTNCCSKGGRHVWAPGGQVPPLYSRSLCHSAICRRGELHTSVQWVSAVPVLLSPPRSSLPITWTERQMDKLLNESPETLRNIKINNQMQPTPWQPYDSTHLFHCPVNPTTLTPTDLWLK